MLLLLAQLASPPIQPGQLAYQQARTNQQPRLPSQTDSETTPSITLPSDELLTPAAEDTSPAGHDTQGPVAPSASSGIFLTKQRSFKLLERCSKANDQASRLQQPDTHRPSAKRWLRELRVYVEAEQPLVSSTWSWDSSLSCGSKAKTPDLSNGCASSSARC